MRKNMKKVIRRMEVPTANLAILAEMFPKNYERVQKFFGTKPGQRRRIK